MAIEYTYDCGHVEIEGGNLADPAALLQRRAGLMEFVKQQGLCLTCREPERFKGILNGV